MNASSIEYDTMTATIKRLEAGNAILAARYSLSKKLVARFMDELCHPTAELQAEYSWLEDLDDSGALARVNHDAIIEAAEHFNSLQMKEACIGSVQTEAFKEYAANLLTRSQEQDDEQSND